MKKIGIVTFHRAINYGGVLQSVALQQKIKELGFDVEEIDYYSKDVYKIYNYFYTGKFHIIKTPIKMILNIIFFVKNIKLKRKFNNFRKKYISMSDLIKNKRDLEKYAKKYDYIISGSDQVWNKDITKKDYDFYDLSLFNTKNKISYAASIGKDIITDQDKSYYNNLIMNYKSVSVRESSLQGFLEKPTFHVLDPVFLINRENWMKIKSNAFNKEKYIFVFSLQQNKNIFRIIDYLSKKQYKIIYYSKVPILKKNVKCVYDVSPEDFLALIYNSEMVVTNSFHCLAFSVIFNKKFVSVLHKDKSSRQVDLLKKINLEDRIYDNNLEYLIQNDIDHKKTQKIIELEIENSNDFLIKALNVTADGIKNVEKLSREKCYGCGACKNSCPAKAIAMKEDSKGFNYPKIDDTKCTQCGVCIKVCPSYNSQNSKNNKHFYAMKIKEEYVRTQSTSGGAFYGLASKILEDGGVVYGAIYDKNLNVIHKRGTKLEDIKKMMGSKYVQSTIENIFKEVKKDLDDNKEVLFSGTPCQIAAIKTFLKKDYLNLILCDIVCHGVPSPRTFKDHISYVESKKNKRIKNYMFRTKEKGWHSTNHLEKIIYDDESVDSTSILSQSFKYFFYSRKTLRDSCFECKFSTLDNRLADITIGDFWGIDKNYCDFDDNIGVSLFITHSAKGMEMFNKIKEKFNYIETEKNKSLQPNLIRPTNKPKGIEKFWSDYNKKGYEYALKKYTPYGIKNGIIYKLKKAVKVIINRT